MDGPKKRITEIPAMFINHFEVRSGVHGDCTRITFGDSIKEVGTDFHTAIILKSEFALKLAAVIIQTHREHAAAVGPTIILPGEVPIKE